MRKTIALVAASLDILGGQGIQARALAGHLSDEGYDVLFVPVNPRFPSWLEWVRRIPVLRTLINELLYLPSLARLRGADVVHIFSASYWSFLLGPVAAILAGRILGKRVVLNYHSGEADDHLLHWGVLVHPWLRLVDDIVVPSKYLQDVFARYGYAARVIQNVVDTSAMQYRERRTLMPRLLSTRNLERHYGVDVILKAFALVRREYPNATLTVAGYGREAQALRELARALSAAGIRFVGRQEPPAMAALYGDADVFVNASIIDNQPVSVLEAFAAGVPVVSTATGDIQNLIGANERGVIVPGADPSAMAAAVISLIAQPERALKMARCAKRHVEAFTWPHVRDAWRAVYERSAPSTGVTGREEYVAEPR